MKEFKSKIWNHISYIGLDYEAINFPDRNKIIANRLNFILFILLLSANVSTAIIREINYGPYSMSTKSLLFLLIITIANYILSYLRAHKIAILNLIFLPSLIVVYLPIIFRNVSEASFVFAPLEIIAFGFIPQLVLDAKFSNRLYSSALIFFFIQIVTLDKIIQYFSPPGQNIFSDIESFHLYYEIVIICVFLFLSLTMYYLRNLNLRYEIEVYENYEELKLTLEELRATQENLVQSEKMASLGILTAGFSHEINNPLNFIQNGVLILENYVNENLPEHKGNLAQMFMAAKVGVSRIAEIVKSLNKYSRNDNLPFTLCNVHEIIDECLTILFNQYKHRIEIIKNFTKETSVVLASEGRMHQIFTNILLNAVQAIESKGLITISTSVINSQILIIIKDDGQGISKDNLKNIFDPFFTTKEPGQGTGLGLSLTHKFVQELHGTIQCQSELSKGTSFIITFPLNS